MLIVLSVVAMGSAASAQTVYVGLPPPGLGPNDVQVLGESSTRSLDRSQQASVQTLAFTGADIIGMCTIAFFAIGTGLVVVRIGRRRRAAAVAV